MAYSTKLQLYKRFPEESVKQLTDDEDDDSKVDERIEDAILNADEEIDSYLRGRYIVPLSLIPLPGMITNISIDLAIYQLYQRQGDQIISDSDSCQIRYDSAIKKLESIQNGTITFVGDGTPNLSCVRTTQNKIYTKEMLDSY